MNRDDFFVKTHIPGLDEIIPGFPEGGLVLVSGPPGSGKTILGMTYIYRGAIEVQEPGLYASMFESKDRFLNLASRLGMDFENLMKKGLVDYLQLPMVLEAGGASAVNLIMEKAKSMGAKRLVIDSITAIKDVFKDPNEARVFLQTILSRVLEQLKCTTILTKEGEPTGRDFEEYVADAVISLERTIFENRNLRILKIEKLRGAEVRFPRACFTIQKGIRALPPTELMMPREPSSPEQVKQALPPDPPEAYTTGVPDLDREIRGYPKGSTVLIEVDPRLTIKEFSTVIAPTVASYILKGRYLMAVPIEGVTIDDIKNVFCLHGVSRQEFLERLYLMVEPGFPGEKTPNTIEIEANEKALERILEISRKLTEKFGHPPIVVFGINRIIRLFGEKKGIQMLHIAKEYVRARRNLMIWVLRIPEERLVNALAPTADVHLKITRRHGCVLLYGVKPRTPLFAVQPDPTSKTPIPRLIPIV